MPINLFLLLSVDVWIIFGNLYLYKFLTKHTEQRTKGKVLINTNMSLNFWMVGLLKFESFCFVLVLHNLDVKKERRRNLIPAKIGVYSIMFLVFFGFLNGLAHSIPFLDNGSRALVSAIFNDAYYCVLAPALVLYGVPSLRRNLSNYIPF